MPKRMRDYRAEYLRRIERGQERGLSRSQSRGHPGPGQPLPSLSGKPPPYNRRLEQGFRAIQEGQSLTAAARQLHVSPERLRRYLHDQGIAERRGNKWIPLPDNRPRPMLMYSNGLEIEVVVDLATSRTVGSYLGSVDRFLNSNDPAWLALYQGRSIIDLAGQEHPFETDPNVLYRLASTSTTGPDKIYRIGV